ncbi:hypothetical protein HY948_04960 [Candidatus Gottesmanbacteria bacterium]|nr:hypothetical protein [Candidatus Gottesmanbacteria bacterium]
MQRMTALFRLTLMFLFTTWILTVTQPASAAWVGKNFGLDNDDSIINNTVSIFPHISNTFYGNIMSITCAIVPFFGPDACTNNRDIHAQLLQKSALANIGSGMAMLYGTPPADFGLWLADTGHTLGFIPKPAYAATGVGFNGLVPLLGIWKAFRNISYVLLAIFMLVVGFMVMFRKKIDPKTVVTVQNSLPRVVVTLVLITFSYAIVGLMIDLMYLVMVLATALLKQGFPDYAENIITKLSFGPIALAGSVSNPTEGGFFTLFMGIFTPIKDMNPSIWVIPDLLSGQFTQAIKDFLAGLLFNTAGIGPLFQLILALVYLFAFIRILFMLLGSYIQILLAVITAPVQILLDVFPGSEMFSNWIKNLVANLAAFPITGFFILLANILVRSVTEGGLWVAPLLPQPVLGVGGVGGVATSLISIGVILAIPTVVGAVKEMMKTKAMPMGFDGGGGGVMQLLTMAYYLKGLAPQDWWGKMFPDGGGKSPSHRP